ncbi:hypothetical protein RRG08_001730 [Elysia crispata]|uniref:Uncharacterized protein n=1 Tax=Elysia crispata TaxID=231223 RepID=A0AAE1AMA8_9GAST|nr:hypothetical protein RRG08_001730 [Elysia crispata]
MQLCLPPRYARANTCLEDTCVTVQNLVGGDGQGVISWPLGSPQVQLGHGGFALRRGEDGSREGIKWLQYHWRAASSQGFESRIKF